MDFSTQVPTVKSAWVHAALSYHARQLRSLPFVDPTPITFLIAKSLRVWLLETRVCSELGYEENLQ
jgi:hypothetical protein